MRSEGNKGRGSGGRGRTKEWKRDIRESTTVIRRRKVIERGKGGGLMSKLESFVIDAFPCIPRFALIFAIIRPREKTILCF